ncbi:MAG TPA: F0F1 ATP synthase subunit delta [Actinomycetes bacterium]|nr:F0F1 ATP synthase subunit delta [Actinomycetes bacterium]
MARVSPALAEHAQALFDQAARPGGITRQRSIDQVASELDAFARLLATQVRLRKALSDPGLPPEPKRALLHELGHGQLDEATVEVLATAAERQRVPAREFTGVVAELAARAAFTAAEEAGELERVEDELFRLATLVERDHRVRSALTNPGLPVENKRAFVAELLAAGGASDRTTALVDLLVEMDEGHDLDREAKALAELAAQRRNRVVAEVRTAVELDGERRARLAEVLTRITGRPVDLRCTVDEAILGSVVVRVGDDLFDGSVRTRLELAREQLGVA